MTNFHGFCSYPHGGWVMVGLTLSCIAALSATMWGVSSCRFAFIDFTSDRGDFSDFYLDPTPDGNPVQYRAGAGLFTWLTPFDEADWSQGQCTGYTELQRDLFSDEMFEVSRIFAVLSVLGGVGVLFWTLFLACISLGKFQIWMYTGILFFETMFVGLTFLLFQSGLCQDLVSYQNDAYETKCTLDQGGLVVIAATLLWCVACLISVIYIKPPQSDLTVRNGQITNAFDQRQLARKQKLKEKKLQQQSQEKTRQQQQQASSRRQQQPPPSPASTSPRSPQSPESIYTSDDGALEVQLGRGGHRGSYQSGTEAEV